MVVNEIRSAVIDTVEFIIPPFIKLLIALVAAHYITHGYVTGYLNGQLETLLTTVDTIKLKASIDNLYLSGVVPIIAILLLITLAYAINRTTSFIGSIVPITYHTAGVLRDKYPVVDIWTYFGDVISLYELDNKIKQLYATAQNTKALKTSFDLIKWQEEARTKTFQRVNFSSFLFIWSIACYQFTVKYAQIVLHPGRLWMILILLFLLILAFYFQITRKNIDIESYKMMIVLELLRTDQKYSALKDTSYEIMKELEKRYDEASKYSKRWWWLSVGYRTDWLTMYRYYRLRPPFYNAYIMAKQRINRMMNE